MPTDQEPARQEQPFETAAASGGGSIPLTSRPPNERGAFTPDVGPRHRRRTSLAARGEPMVWLTGGAAALAVLMIAGLFVLVGAYGFTTFWPEPLVRVAFDADPGDAVDRRTLVGEPFRDDVEEVLVDADGDGEPDAEQEIPRRLWMTGNREIAGAAFTWVREDRVLETSRPDDFLLVERDEEGRAIGRLEAVAIDGALYQGFDDAWPAMQRVLPDVRRLGRRIFDNKTKLAELGTERVDLRQTLRDLPDDADAQRADLEARLDEIAAEEAELEAEIERLDRQVDRYRVFLRTEQGPVVSVSRTRVTRDVAARDVLGRDQLEGVAGVRFVDFTTDNTRPATPDDVPMGREENADLVDGATLVVPGPGDPQPKLQFIDDAGEPVGEPYALPPRALVLVDDGEELTAGDRVAVEPLAMTMGQVVRAYPPNRLDFAGKVGVYASRWWEFLSDDPRDANTEGGVWPHVVGTVLLTFIMIVFVVPIGVVAAIYLREYAKQGPLVSFVRICVNNLAGVPSIVYGVFGLGFFVYGVGGWIDGGAAGAGVDPLTTGTWLLWLAAAVIFVLLAVAATSLAARFDKGAATDATLVPRLFRVAAGLAWAASVGVVFYYVVASIPTGVFGGFFPDTLETGSSVWKGQALIWASLTLALLTLPVVIVATEEALAAVPRSMREGSYACGASQWQTIRTIVLPRALPGIMTGAILAIARGAGEVAPIMLVGALENAPLPVTGDAPFVHLDQAFMHLGFQIYHLGFKSPDAEAARAMVYTTTLLLIAIVLALNLTAIALRSRLQRAFAGGQF